VKLIATNVHEAARRQMANGLHILFIVTSTVLYTLLHRGAGGSVLVAMVFHTGWNLMPEVVLFSLSAELSCSGRSRCLPSLGSSFL
jgi:membrane protease YdiL (CAAX protease family)